MNREMLKKSQNDDAEFLESQCGNEL